MSLESGGRADKRDEASEEKKKVNKRRGNNG